jgi:hypothetical protein
MLNDKNLANWAEGSNTQAVLPGIREIAQDPDLYDEDDEV